MSTKPKGACGVVYRDEPLPLSDSEGFCRVEAEAHGFALRIEGIEVDVRDDAEGCGGRVGSELGKVFVGKLGFRRVFIVRGRGGHSMGRHNCVDNIGKVGFLENSRSKGWADLWRVVWDEAESDPPLREPDVQLLYSLRLHSKLLRP